jgi:hypothetical protein
MRASLGHSSNEIGLAAMDTFQRDGNLLIDGCIKYFLTNLTDMISLRSHD